jgi:IS605 OrfB family transposase
VTAAAVAEKKPRGKPVVGTLQAYRFALDPTPTQIRDLRSHAGAARFAYNWGLAEIKANLGQREAEATYGVGQDDLTPSLSWSAYSLRDGWNEAKATTAPWWADNSKEVYANGLANLAQALKNWGESRKGARKGRKVDFPRFKSRDKATPSFRFTTGAIRCETMHAVLPRLGRIKLHEDASALACKVTAGTARILSATVRYTRGRWFVAFTVDLARPAGTPTDPDVIVGVDLGIKTLAVLSTGEVIENPKHLKAATRKLKRLQRAVSRRRGPYDVKSRRRQTPSGRYERAAKALSSAHGRVADLRRDGIHKATTQIASRFGTVVVEDLNVAGMLANHRLARAVADASFGEIRRQLTYKTGWNGGTLIVADRWFPSSKTCSGCGAVKTKLRLSTRTYVCTACGLVLDRDENAARNLAAYGREAMVAGSGSETVNGRGAGRKPSPSGAVAGSEASHPAPLSAGQTGTAPTARCETATRVSANAH